MQRSRRLLLIAVALTTLVALAGCSGALTGSLGPSVSNANVDVDDNGAPVIEFDYSVNDYSTILLEGPSNEILNEKELSPENNHSSLYMKNPRPGNYRLVVQQGGETQVTKTVSFNGPQPEVQAVSANWSGNTVEAVHVTIQNTGDLPAGVVNASYTARGQATDSSPINKWIAPNDTTTVEASASFASSVTVTEPGTVRGTVDVRTLNTTLTGSFERTFQGANLTVTNITDYWSGNTLERVKVEVANTGDLPTTANVSVDTTNDNFGIATQSISPGQSRVFERGGILFNVDTVQTAGNTTYDIVIDSPSGYVTESFTHKIEPADVTLDTLQPVWENGQLTRVKFTASNVGELETDFTATLAVNGQTVHEDTGSIDATTTAESFELSTGFLNDGFYTVNDAGSYDVTLTLEGSSWTASDTKSTTFDGKDASISSVDATFLGNYNADTSDLSTLNFQLQNTGDIPLNYDSVEVVADGTTSTNSLSTASTVEPGTSTTVFSYPELTVSNGQHETVIRVLNGGDVVAETTVTLST